MYSLLLVVNVLSGIGVIGLVLIQHGKGADMGAAFGGGSSGSLFGATGSSNFLSKMTAILATVFIVSCLGLNHMAGTQTRGGSSVVDSIKQTEPVNDVPAPSAPAADDRAKDVPK